MNVILLVIQVKESTKLKDVTKAAPLMKTIRCFH